ncbi:MAG: glycosyltransferase [Flavobacteriales bacterium]
MNVLIISDLYPRFEGDVRGVFVRDFAKSLSKFCNITVFHPVFTGKIAGIEKTEDAGFSVISFTAANTPKTIVNKALIYRRLLKKSPEICHDIGHFDIVHAHGSVISGSIARKMTVPYLITEHTGPFSAISSRPLLLSRAKSNIRKAAVLLPVSRHLENEMLQSGIRPAKTIVAGNPIDDALFSMAPTPEKRPHNILFAARLDNLKGGMRTLRAFGHLAGKRAGWTLSIIGDGDEKEEMQHFIALNGIEDRVRLRGFVSRKELKGEMHHSAFFVLPSAHESFGLVIAEAMACGLPVIGPCSSAPPEIVDDACGLLIDPSDVDAIEEAMDGMMDNYQNYQGNQIRQAICKRFGMQVFGKRIYEIYKEVLKCAE